MHPWVRDARHLRRTGHMPVWRQFDSQLVCEACIKPKNPNASVRKLQLVPILSQ